MTTSLLAFFGSFDPFLSRRDSTGLFSAFNLNFWNGYAGWEGQGVSFAFRLGMAEVGAWEFAISEAEGCAAHLLLLKR